MIDISAQYTKPMMSDNEITIVHGLLHQKLNAVCLEWGSGNSTIYFPKENNIKHWISVEHNPEYIDYVIKNTNRKLVTVFPIAANPVYYETLQAYKGQFDFILIDGIYRKECLEVALQIARKDTTVILHDAERREYAEWINQYPYDILIHGEIEDGNKYCKHRGIARFLL